LTAPVPVIRFVHVETSDSTPRKPNPDTKDKELDGRTCVFLKGSSYKVCMAYDDIMILSVEELEKYCSSSHYHLCPTYRKFQKQGSKIPVEQHESYKFFGKA